MHNEKISEIIAHFIGIFDAATDDMRMRVKHLEGEGPDRGPADPPLNVERPLEFSSILELKDYDPSLSYRSEYYGYDHPDGAGGRAFPYRPAQLEDIDSRAVAAPHFGNIALYPVVEVEQELTIHPGPGSTIAHLVQVNVLYDDDYLNMTDGPNTPRDTSFVIERLAEFNQDAAVFAPFSQLQRVDTYAGLEAIAGQMRDYIHTAEQSGSSSLGTDAEVDFVLAGREINGTYVNGQLVAEAPKLDDFMPDRGIAKPAEKPEGVDEDLELIGPSGSSLDVAAGANILTNIVSVVETSVIAPVSAVFGNYHQIDVITQAFVYSDRDEIDAVFETQNSSATVGMNIAIFERDTYAPPSGNTAPPAGDAALVFPTAWRVSVIEGDVSFIHWIEQYQFVTDNDTMTVTTGGFEASVLTGGNVAVNLASFFGLGMQYDLVIIGGHVLDINAITQISILYDNDWVRADGDIGDAAVQSGNNLIWNLASIENVGGNDRFETMPDYMIDTVRAINDRDVDIPVGLSGDPVFAGYEGLNVLYITGNLYDVTVIKQVSILGDSDDVTQATANVLQNSPNAVVTIDTGSNTLVNIAQIVDYDSFGTTTYVGGQVYSDAILIQGGLIENDTSQPATPGSQLANEVIAFLDNDDPSQGSGDASINTGNDYSWQLTSPADMMQTIVA